MSGAEPRLPFRGRDAFGWSVESSVIGVKISVATPHRQRAGSSGGPLSSNTSLRMMSGR
jgi:hypothetical protein